MSRKTRHKITYENDLDALCVAMASMGLSTDAIQYKTSFTTSQITYRLAKAKRLEGLASGYRVGWRNGESPVAHRIQIDMVKVLTVDFQRKLPRRIFHPPAKGASE